MAGSVDQVRKTKKPGQEAVILTIVVLHPIVSVEKKLQVNNFLLRRVYKVLCGVWDLSEVDTQGVSKVRSDFFFA